MRKLNGDTHLIFFWYRGYDITNSGEGFWTMDDEHGGDSDEPSPILGSTSYVFATRTCVEIARTDSSAGCWLARYAKGGTSMLMLGTMGSISWRGMLASRALEHAICQSQFAKCKSCESHQWLWGFEMIGTSGRTRTNLWLGWSACMHCRIILFSNPFLNTRWRCLKWKWRVGIRAGVVTVTIRRAAWPHKLTQFLATWAAKQAQAAE